MKVLIVDDEQDIVDALKIYLSSQEYELYEAHTGKEALEIYRKANGRFDLIFMDVLMPVMDGLEATRAIRSMTYIPGSLEIPIAAMTANAFVKNFEESFRAGMNAHLVKPIEPVSFYRIITELLPKKK